jgi:hypothetical protein
MKKFEFTDGRERDMTLKICRTFGVSTEDYTIQGFWKSLVLVDDSKSEAFNKAILEAKKLLSEQDKINEQVETGVINGSAPKAVAGDSNNQVKM